jgi:prepilin signal peptidase PulO-like enzyme (type II secretory pathway)
MRAELAVEYSLFVLVAAPILVFDVREYRIPDFLSVGGLLLLSGLQLAFAQATLGEIAVECCLGYGSFWLIHRLTRGGMGLGDAKFSALIAVAVGGVLPWLVALLAASLAGLAFAGFMIFVLGRDRRARIPFAPFLALGAMVSVVVERFLPRL